MNSLLLLALLATAAAASVNIQVPGVPKKTEAAEIPHVAQVAAVAEVAKNDEIEYDEDGVPRQTIPVSRQSLRVGVVGLDDRLVSRTTHNVAAAAYIIHDQDVIFRFAHQTNITSIQVARVGTTTQATPTIKSGGLGQSYVFINILGVRGSGFSYTISIHASINCANS